MTLLVFGCETCGAVALRYQGKGGYTVPYCDHNKITGWGEQMKFLGYTGGITIPEK